MPTTTTPALVLQAIQTIARDKQQAHRHPSHVLYSELTHHLHLDRPTLNAALNALYKQRAIRVGSTLNEPYISPA